MFASPTSPNRTGLPYRRSTHRMTDGQSAQEFGGLPVAGAAQLADEQVPDLPEVRRGIDVLALRAGFVVAGPGGPPAERVCDHLLFTGPLEQDRGDDCRRQVRPYGNDPVIDHESRAML